MVSPVVWFVCVYNVWSHATQCPYVGMRKPKRSRHHNGPVPVTKIRTVRVDDELWEAAQARAADRRESVADVIRRALLAYVETPIP